VDERRAEGGAMEPRRVWFKGWRAFVLIAIGLVLGEQMLVPATAHIGTTVSHLWGHIRPLADARYLRAGQIQLNDSGPWTINASLNDAVAQEFLNSSRILATGTNDAWAMLHLTSPRVIGRRSYGLKRVRLCYRVSAGDRIDETSIFVQGSTGQANEVIQDLTDRTASVEPFTCYSISSATPISVNGTAVLVLQFGQNAVDDFIDVSNVTTTWVVTGPASA
jgi:hypothetical protein